MNAFRIGAGLVASAIALLAACGGTPEIDSFRPPPNEQLPERDVDATESTSVDSPGEAEGDATNGESPSGAADGDVPAPGADDDDPPGAMKGKGGRAAAGEHCCFRGEYLRCPDTNACLGGFDAQACFAACKDPRSECFKECLAKLQNAGPPKGCDANAAPPPHVDCAKGRIDAE